MARRNNQRKNSRASQKGASPPTSSPQKPMPPPTNPEPAPATPVDYRTSYADRLLSNDERFKRHQRVTAQKARVTHINANPEKYRQKMESLEKTPDIADGMNQAAINEWEDFIFSKMQEDGNNEDHALEDFL